MDRSYVAPHTVKVFATERTGKLLRVTSLVPYSSCGYDTYRFEGRFYPGYHHPETGTYILIGEEHGC